jgi:Zinc finger, C3HC4 type (RING finger)
MAPNDDPTHRDSHDHHGLEFEYDCDAPKCGIYVHVLVSPEDNKDNAGSGLTRILVFETVVEGGFGKILKLEEGATLELGRFEKHHAVHAAEDPSVSNTVVNTTTTSSGPSDDAPRKSRRFSHFHFRKRDHGREIAGPALAVVDAETATAPTESTKDKGAKDDADVKEGVRVTIQLVALDADGQPLSSPNEQGTYLHVVRMGTAPAEGEEDSRPWVVQVVKREATIGPHTFHLHEIYGLSSQSSAPVAPIAPAVPPTSTDDETHTYPPTMTTSPTLPVVTAHEDEPSSECLLCLSSAREVVLLPCRHLVACKECAMNMVEFGAGGTIVQPEAEVSTTGANDNAAAGGVDGANAQTAGAGTAPAPIPSTVTTAPNNRRKRKAKGWFCPVCRQRK